MASAYDDVVCVVTHHNNVVVYKLQVMLCKGNDLFLLENKIKISMTNSLDSCFVTF